MIVEALRVWVLGRTDELAQKGLQVKSIRENDDSASSARSIYVHVHASDFELELMLWEKGDFERHLFSQKKGESVVFYQEAHDVETVVKLFESSIDLLLNPDAAC